MAPRPLGWRREAESDRAEELYPYMAADVPETVELVLRLPSWLRSHDQGAEGSCVGHAVALERAISNTSELRRLVKFGYRRYDPIELWRAAKDVDEWSYTRPEDDHGTSVRAAYQVAKAVGLRRVRSMKLDAAGRPAPVAPAAEPLEGAGVLAYSWARHVDAVRAAIAGGSPVAIGVQWYTGFDSPADRPTGRRGRLERWLPEKSSAGRVRGGHSVTLAGASDRREAFLLVNSWGLEYPPVWLPYSTMGALLTARGEAAVVTDRPEPF